MGGVIGWRPGRNKADCRTWGEPRRGGLLCRKSGRRRSPRLPKIKKVSCPGRVIDLRWRLSKPFRTGKPVMTPHLVALSEGPNLPIDKPILLLGRHQECDVQIPSRKISRKHCCIA